MEPELRRRHGAFAKPGVYVNLMGDPSPGAVVAGFGSEKYTRLVAVKEEYDPENVFPQQHEHPPAGD